MTRLTGALRRRLDPASESGISLVELIVVMMVSGVVLAIVGAMFVNVASVTSYANTANTRNATASNVMNAMAKAISTASNNEVAGASNPADPAIVSGTATALTVITYIDTDPTNPTPTRVTFRVDGSGQVFEDRIASSVSNSYFVFTSAATSRSLGGPVISTGMFTYFDKSGAVIPIPAAGLTLAQRNSVASIRVTVTIANNSKAGGTTTDPAGNDPVQLMNTVNMPNVILTGSD